MAPPAPIDWVRKLYAKLVDQRKHARKYDVYYSGEHRLEIIEQDFREVFGTKAGSAITSMLEPARVNISRVAIEALTERMIIDGFAVGDDDNQQGADVTRRIWMDNDLDEMSGVAHLEAAVKGAAYTLVWPDSDNDPVVSIEDPEQMAIARMSVPPYDVIAALKVWRDEWSGDEMADLYLPDFVYRWRRNRNAINGGGSLLVVPAFVTSVSTSDWLPQSFDNTQETLENKFGRVPVTELANRARLLKPPQSDLVDVAPLHDAADKILADLIIAASFGAVPVRFATGLKILADKQGKPVDADGNPVTPMDVRADRFLTSPDPSSRFGTLDGSNLEGFVKASNEIMARFRTVTRVPYHYIDMGGTSGVAGETLVAFEGPLNRRKAGTCLRVGSGWRRTMSICLSLKSDFSGQSVITRWADTESKSVAQEADAFSKLVKSGTPLEVAMEKVLGWPRETIKRALQLRAKEGLAADAAFAAVQKDAQQGGPTDTVPVVPAPVG